MESVVIDRSPSYPSTRFGSVDGRLLVSKSFNTTTRSNSLLGQKSTTFNASFAPSLLHQPPLLPLPGTTASRSAFPRRPTHKKPFYGEARGGGVLVIDKSKEKEAAPPPPPSSSSSSSSFVWSVSPPPPSSVPMPRFSITRGKKAAGGGSAAAGNCVAAAAAEEDGCGGVDVCATDGLRRLLRI